MTSQAAMEILQLMADGVDPATGEILAADHLCNQPDVIRALVVAIRALSAEQPTPPIVYNRKSDKLNAGRPWTEEDLAALKQLYLSGLPMNAICKQLQRRERGVQQQLCRLGLIEIQKDPAHAPVPGLERAGLPWTQDEDALLKTLHAAHWPIPSIAAKMQRSDYSIFCRMDKLELYGEQYGYPAKEHQPKWTRTDDKTLQEMFQSGISTAEMAQSLHRPETSIAARLFYRGLTKDCPLPPLRKKQ